MALRATTYVIGHGRGSSHGLDAGRGDPWQTYAACGGKDPAMFETPAKRVDGIRQAAVERARRAIALCHGCPVQPECHEDALKDRPRGMIRAAVPYDDSGFPAPNCVLCGEPVLSGDSRGRFCEEHSARDLTRERFGAVADVERERSDMRHPGLSTGPFVPRAPTPDSRTS